MNEKTGKILIIDDNEDILFALKLLLKQHIELIQTSNNPQEIPSLMKKEDYDIILLDMNFTKDVISGREGFGWLKKILEIDPSAIVLFITAYGDAEKAVKAIKAGATDFILKPWRNEKLLATISSAIQLKRSKVEVNSLRKKQKDINLAIDSPFQEFIGSSEEMGKIFKTIEKVARTDANILILGENGTGKELVARALHRSSLRKEQAFISIDLGSITETLFESELFGHAKGAFTDAKNEKTGRFEIASGGTLFLDEIGNLSLSLQTKILTVIEKREISKVGSNKIIPIDVRLVCATNNNLHQLVEDNLFRQDLLYRVNTVEICLPPLRERKGDIDILAKHFLAIYTKKYNKKIKKITTSALNQLNKYHWPGNVRELQHAIERAVILGESDILNTEDFILNSHQSKSDKLQFDTHDLETIEKDIIDRVLKMYNGNITKAAKELGLTRTSLYRRIEKHGL